ncbi:LysR family transcriptional regulator [Roseomonas hellenica]|uniref:LysR family transcriptional regulator n=1 Tax=Plastoroseomonas hellenica TaxID=2687306 RepID=A0ABS5ESG6_9PROT|nr:LysR family transcriptional regulator [Plastoroseomonas hellenica]MBR0663237.1 LysR family transcriptional regulator [Plastoroseomonas hellenica]
MADLQAFAHVGETRSLTRAAALLNVTQPAVSKRIRALEAWVGKPLVERRANRIALTEAGAAYAAAITQGFAVLQGATDALMRPPSGPLRVRAYTTWALRWLIPRLPQYYLLQSDHAVEVTTSLLPVDFSTDAVDAAVRMAPGNAPLPGATRLWRHAIMPYAAPTIAAAARARLGEATLLASLARPRDWASWAAARGVALPDRVVSFESTSLAIQAAIQGMGVVIASPMLVEEDVREGRLAPLGDTPLQTEDYYWLLMPPGRVRPEAVMFCGWLLREISLLEAG